MQPTRKARKVERIVKQLNKLQAIAEELDLQLGNGAEVGALLGSMADELQNSLEHGQFD